MANKNHYQTVVIFCLSLFALTGCEKSISHYYTDQEKPGTAIFSNTANNVASCLFNGHPWRTVDRLSQITLGNGYGTELQIRRIRTSSTQDTLIITWQRDYSNVDQYDISLLLPVAKNFTWNDMSSFQGKRFSLDSTNGYFGLSRNYVNIIGGKGSVYFNTAYLDTTAGSGVSFNGRISGLFEAHFNTNSINAVVNSGRFDDAITAGEIRNY